MYEVPIQDIDCSQALTVQMKQEASALGEVVVKARMAVAEDFSVHKLEPLDVYFNPIAKGDPLNAIQLLPASTDTEESASPSLRGSIPNRSIVVVEGVPVRNPVRYTQINGLGSFSIFSTELMKEQLVFASNPPLVYGQSTAGLIELKLREKGGSDGFSIGAGLAQLAASWTKNFEDEKGYVQIYGNHSFSALYRAVNASVLTQLNDFGSTDVGIRYFRKLNDKAKLSVLSYSSTEGYDVDLNLFSYGSNGIGKQLRNFNIAKVEWGSLHNVWTANVGADISKSNFDFGNLSSQIERHEVYSALNYRRNAEGFVLQTGLNYRYTQDDFTEQFPRYFFAMSPESPSFQLDTVLNTHDVQGYIYAKAYLGNFTVSGGLRQNVPINGQPSFTSYQGAVRFQPFSNHSFLLSAGRYHAYNYPTSAQRNNRLLHSEQFAFEYELDINNTRLSTAVFHKKEDNIESFSNSLTEEAAGERTIKGLEIAVQTKIGPNLTLDVANTILNGTVKDGDLEYRISNEMKYLVKVGLTYFNNDLFNWGISYIGRPGKYYTDITHGMDIGMDFQLPVFENAINSSQFGAYNSISLTANRLFKLKNGKNLVIYMVMNNVLNNKNQSGIMYNNTYSERSYTYYSHRWLYFGGMISL